MKFWVTLGCLAVLGASGSAFELSDADVGNWTVEPCILAQFAMEFTARPNKTNVNETLHLVVPKDAKADQDKANCAVNKNTLSLDWSERSKNGTVLARNLTIEFSRSNKTA